MSFVEPPAPISVQPVTVDSSLGAEISVPFHIDTATGGVATINQELEIIDQHLVTLINTVVGERVMLAYGSQVLASVFAPMNTALPQLLAQDLQEAIKTWEPTIQVTNVSILPDPISTTAIDIAIEYVVLPFKQVNSVSVQLGGTVTQVVNP
jgi:uncharacterized protein